MTIIRSGTFADIPFIQNLLVAADLDAGSWDERELADVIDGGLCFVAEFDGQLTGAMWGCTMRGFGAYVFERAVLPEFQGHGIGKQLREHFVAECKTRGIEWIESHIVNNPAALAFAKEPGNFITHKNLTEVITLTD